MEKHGYVYIAKCEDKKNNSYYKIGMTHSDPLQRISGFQTGNPFKVRLENFYKFEGNGCEIIEQAIHKTLDDFRLQGEWFDGSEPMEKKLDEIRKQLSCYERIYCTDFIENAIKKVKKA